MMMELRILVEDDDKDGVKGGVENQVLRFEFQMELEIKFTFDSLT